VGALQTHSPFKNLCWKAANLALKAGFLDLNLEIKNRHIVIKMYEKPTELFLCILPLTSAHSPEVLFKSIISGNVHHYWYQHSNIDDY
jgi:hypothetical protein